MFIESISHVPGAMRTVLGGTAGIVTLFVLGAKLSAGLFKRQARADVTRKPLPQPSEGETSTTCNTQRTYIEGHAPRSWSPIGSHH